MTMETHVSHPPAIILDADMVLVDYIGQLVRYMAERHGVQPAMPYEQEDDYNLTGMYPALAGGLRPYILGLARDPDYYASIPFLPGAERALADIRAALPGVPLVCVTSGGSDPVTRELRLANLAPLGLDEVVTLPLGAAKADVLAGFAPGCWFVDDMPRHVAEAEAAGHRGILFHHRYNAGAPAMHRADGWPAVVETVLAPLPARAAGMR